MSAAKTCKACRWWDTEETWTVKQPAHEMHPCRRYLSHKGNEASAIVTCSGPEFGCVHFEAKATATAPSVEACGVHDYSIPGASCVCPPLAPTAAKGDELCAWCAAPKENWRHDATDPMFQHTYRPKPSTTEPKP